MSLSLARLRLLQQQAGRSAPASAPDGATGADQATGRLGRAGRFDASIGAAVEAASTTASVAGRGRPCVADAPARPPLSATSATTPAASRPPFAAPQAGPGTAAPPSPAALARRAAAAAAADARIAGAQAQRTRAQARPIPVGPGPQRPSIAPAAAPPAAPNTQAASAASASQAHPDRPDPSAAGTTMAPIFGADGLAPSPPQRTDLDALRRLIALRERKPGAACPDMLTTAATAPPPALPGASLHGPAPLPARLARAAAVDRSLPGEEIAPGLFLVQAHLPMPMPAGPLSLAFAKRPGEQADPRRLLFFDTETTGLAGGTGTRAFMIGAADWHAHPQQGEGLRIRQLTIARLSAEPAMLRHFADWLAPETVLSSYNGRCFDAPLLNTRYRLARQPSPLAGLDHVDLLFPTRRRYRGVWENCRLATIERELLRIVREDDLPGAQAPAAWLQFLRGGGSGLLRRVLAHNHQDVVTLAQLLLRLVQAQAEEEASVPAWTPQD